MSNVVVTKEASVFYTLVALLKVSNRYADYLCDSGEVAYTLKSDLRRLQNRIKDLDSKCNNSLDGNDADLWRKEWSEKDFEVYSSILFTLADMNEEQRSVAEQFMMELKKGNVKVELAV